MRKRPSWRIGIAMVGFVVATQTVFPQAPVSFEVASVRRAAPVTEITELVAGVIRAQPNGQLTGTSPLKLWVTWAYGLAPYQHIEGSFRELEEWFAINAKAPDGTRPSAPGEVDPVRLMAQALLAERFKLKVRWEDRPQAVAVLRRISPDRLGPKLKRLEVDCSQTNDQATSPARGCLSQIRTVHGPSNIDAVVRRMSDFTDLLARIADRPVVDDTGLVGPFEFTTSFNPGSLNERFNDRLSQNLRSLADALRDDLGLRLETERRPVGVLIVEHVEPPTEN